MCRTSEEVREGLGWGNGLEEMERRKEKATYEGGGPHSWRGLGASQWEGEGGPWPGHPGTVAFGL